MDRITADLSEMDSLKITLRGSTSLYPRPVVSAEMRDALRPMETAARNEAPIRQEVRAGKRVYGGATRRDVRTKMVDSPDTLVTGLVGVSKASGKVGWRTHFLTGGTVRMRANNFLKRAYDNTIDIVAGRMGMFLGRRLEAYFNGVRFNRNKK